MSSTSYNLKKGMEWNDQILQELIDWVLVTCEGHLYSHLLYETIYRKWDAAMLVLLLLILA